MAFRVRAGAPPDLEAVIRMRALLLPEMSAEENRADTGAALAGRPLSPMAQAILVADDGRGAPVGFVYVGLRSYADGCDTAPVGYVEEWYVEPEQRRAGIGRALIAAAAEWTRGQGCSELASDALTVNEVSHQAHRALGFEEVGRAVQYRMSVGPGRRRRGWTALHRIVGGLGVLGFLATGLYMRAAFPEIHGGDGAIRFAFRANHVYLLLSALLNLLAGALPPSTGRARAAGSALLLAAPALLALAFALEAPRGAASRPITLAGIVCLLAGTLLVSIFARRARG